jgi:hypothetical protein
MYVGYKIVPGVYERYYYVATGRYPVPTDVEYLKQTLANFVIKK